MTSAVRRWALALAFLFFAAHLPFLAPELEDIDSLNFALGVRDFDPARHQPHPPGYPLFIALGKLGRAAGLSEAHALAIWGAFFGALMVISLVQLFRAIEGVSERSAATPRGRVEEAETRAALAAALTAVCPLVWFTAVRPMSDMPGLAVALSAQALLTRAFWRQRGMQPNDGEAVAESGRLIVLGALAAALALGFRAQTIWLTVPLLMLVILDRVGRGAAGAILGASLAFAIGVSSWAIPMLIASGGIRAYVAALGSQAGEDFSGVDMLIRHPTPRALAAAVINTAVLPWSSNALGAVAIACAMVGCGILAVRARMALVVLMALVLPYAVLHLLFQETVTTRYALPLIPPFCYLIVRGLCVAGRRAAVAATAMLAVWAASIAIPAVSLYASRPSPVFRALSDIKSASAGSSVQPAVAMHYVFARAAETAPPPARRMLEALPKHEWLSAARYWLDDHARTLWFLSDPTRTDLALVDPASRRLREAYRWPRELDVLLSGVRPSSVDWVEISDPGWLLMQGWDLTPETAGVARLDGVRPGSAPIVGYLRRRAGPATLLIGGRNLNPLQRGNSVVIAAIDGNVIGTYAAPPAPGFFLRIFELPPGALEGVGHYARLEIKAFGPDPSVAPNVGIEQFNLQPSESVMWGFDAGWHEQEFNPSTARLWRWTSDRAETLVHHGTSDLVLTIAGESPLRYFARPAYLKVRAGSLVLREEELSDDFEVMVRVPAAALDAADHRLTLETDETFVPAERGQNQDRRRLGLRIWKLELRREEKGGDRRS